MMLQLKRGMTEAALCVFMCVRVCNGNVRWIAAPTQPREDTAARQLENIFEL